MLDLCLYFIPAHRLKVSGWLPILKCAGIPYLQGPAIFLSGALLETSVRQFHVFRGAQFRCQPLALRILHEI